MNSINLIERLRGSLIAGTIGDCIGNRYEGSEPGDIIEWDFNWQISDDTQMTLATCEAIYDKKIIKPEEVANSFLNWYNKGRITGVGSATLKALRELQVGGHWALVGRSGEFAAGNGAAMRIAPLAFKNVSENFIIKDICNITHKNDEAYIGALAVYYAIKYAIGGKWCGYSDLIEKIIPLLPDTLIRDKLLEFQKFKNEPLQYLKTVPRPTGYVVDSVPVALFAAQKIHESSLEEIILNLTALGGDTDTVCSICSQIIGALKGTNGIPEHWIEKYKRLYASEIIENLVCNWKF
ncbi:ADP-ribosylglycohydrolase family protein [Apibacter raozihei]|uniref:ADP-ribosylglycohydrolase family protein n=1 Tax=Apibacter raozihei TaxID=2500547 RepID=UPI000FE2DAD0|nr:ADP-ribosylglycohydrolase family protein [Apibacter raozihei]